MTVKAEVEVAAAHYTPASLDAFRGNPLIEALPDFLEVRPTEIFRRLALKPAPIALQSSRRQRAQWLMNVTVHCFIPVVRHMELYDIVDLMIRQGYLHRAPGIGPQYFDDAQERFAAEAKLKGYAQSNYHEPLSTSVIGCSGIGKTCGVLRVLSLYKQVIDHKPPFVPEPIRQVVYMKVETPGTVKALCASIITELGRLTGMPYADQYVKNRATLESLQSRVVYLMSLHRVGILVLDEMQNLVIKHKNRDEIFNFIVYLSNALDVPLLFIGTPKLMRFMCANLRTARRFGSFGIARWERYEKGSADWKNFIRELWHYQVLQDNPPQMPSNVEDALYRSSQGIVDILMKLFILSQMKAIQKYCERKSEKEELTPALIEEVFQKELGNVAPMIEALRNGDSKAIERYEDIAVPQDAYQNAARKTYAEIEQATEDMPEERQAEEAMHELDRRLETLREVASPELRALLNELIEQGVTSENILLALAREPKTEDGGKAEASGSGMTLSEDFSPQQGGIE